MFTSRRTQVDSSAARLSRMIAAWHCEPVVNDGAPLVPGPEHVGIDEDLLSAKAIFYRFEYLIRKGIGVRAVADKDPGHSAPSKRILMVAVGSLQAGPGCGLRCGLLSD